MGNEKWIFIILVWWILWLIAVGLSIRTWYWRRKIKALQEKADENG